MCSACSIPAGPPPPAAVPIPAAPAPGEARERAVREVLEAVNRTREENGLRPLQVDAALARAAREHSEELATRRTLDHTSTNPARRTLTMRIEAAGGSWNRAAENLANMNAPVSTLADRTAQIWMRSPGHRRNMLEPAYTHTGIGAAIDDRGMWYITQVYVLPRQR